MQSKRTRTNESKIGQINNGINSTTKAQLKKIQNANFDKSLPNVKYSDLYMFVNKKWTYKGKSCMLCDKVMNDPTVLEHHHYICTVNIQKHRHTGTD